MALTDEDKKWMVETLDGRMEAYLVGLAETDKKLMGMLDKLQVRGDIRFHGLEANMRVAQVRLDELEERVKRLEVKK